jgi:hypothetical protein
VLFRPALLWTYVSLGTCRFQFQFPIDRISQLSSNRGVQDALRRYEYDKRLLCRISVYMRLIPLELTSLASVLIGGFQRDFLPIRIIDVDYHRVSQSFRRSFDFLAWPGVGLQNLVVSLLLRKAGYLLTAGVITVSFDICALVSWTRLPLRHVSIPGLRGMGTS